jgi:hypothetical protein
MEAKRINIALVFTSLLGYLEWGKDNAQFLFQAEADIFRKFFQDPQSLIHPFVLLPLFGQLMLIITLFQKVPSKRLSLWAVLCLGLLLGFMLIIGLMAMRWKIVISVLPFVSVLILFIRQWAKIPSSS